jgi:hypothetical protein
MVDFRIDTFEEFGEPASPASGQRSEVPEGWHEFKIARILEDDDKLELQLAHDEPSYWWVKVRIPKANTPAWAKKLVGQLAGVLAMSPAQWQATPIDEFTGCRVDAEIRHRQKDQKTFVNVWGFRPTQASRQADKDDRQAAERARATAKRTSSQKATAAMDNRDAEPF